ncbi:rod shape-determining protein MreC [candidate division WWE3 bacterium]|uniref:Cell shape-determining protein MreC n=1 Tax=candidate division WWE3 bacterium TaxID=2053526 RepID=A0A928TUV7_UNCKA|nr:rod shape-determining protein MreC [candidate division WWE3 bacterium]
MPKPRPWFIGLLGLSALLLLGLAGFIGPVRETVRAVLLPVARLTSNVGASIGRMMRLDRETGEANRRAEELEARLRNTTVDYVRLRALEEENRSLRAQAKFITEKGYQTIGARVIARAITYQTAVVTVDRGSKDGVEIGQAVVTEEGILVGKVLSIGERTASVMLLSDIRSRVASKVSGADRLSGVVEGRGNGAAHFTLVPQSQPLERDNVIVTAGTEERVPPNLVVGIVNDVEAKPTDPFKNAVIEPLAPLERLELVAIVIPGS